MPRAKRSPHHHHIRQLEDCIKLAQSVQNDDVTTGMRVGTHAGIWECLQGVIKPFRSAWCNHGLP